MGILEHRRRAVAALGVVAAVILALASRAIEGGPRGPILRSTALDAPVDWASITVDEGAGRAVVYGGTDPPTRNTVWLLDAATATRLQAMRLDDGATDIAYSPAARRLFALVPSVGAGGTGYVRLYDTASGRAVDRWRPGLFGLDHLALDEQTGRLFVTEDGYVHVFDIKAGRAVRTVRLRMGGVFNDAGVDARAGRFYAATDACTVVTLDAATGRLIGEHPLCAGGGEGGWYGWLAVDDRRHRVYLWSKPWGHVVVLDGRTGAAVDTIDTGIGHVPQPAYGAVDPLTGHLYVFDGRAALVFDGPTGHTLRALHRPISGLAVGGRAGRVLALAGTDLLVLDGRTDRPLRAIPFAAPILAVAVDGRAGRALVVTAGATVRVPDPWPWVPRWLRRRLPFLPAAPQTRAIPASVDIVDVTAP